MSYIRFGQPRQYSDGDPIYAYPTGGGNVRIHGTEDAATVSGDDWIEVTMRIMNRHDVDYDARAEVLKALHDEFSEFDEEDLIESPEDL